MENAKQVPCSKCGLLRVVGKKCKPCTADYRAKNSESAKLYMAKYRVDNYEKIKIKAAQKYLKNIDWHNKKYKKYAAENPEKIRMYKTKWSTNNPSHSTTKNAAYRDDLAPSYIASLLKTPTSELTENDYKMHKAILHLKRTIKHAQKALNDTN